MDNEPRDGSIDAIMGPANAGSLQDRGGSDSQTATSKIIETIGAEPRELANLRTRLAASEYEIVSFSRQSLPLIGELPPAPAVSESFDLRPGAVGLSAASWSQRQQNASTDLLLDFVTPELMLAARTFGFSISDVMLATRLGADGPVALAALAEQVDRQFLKAAALIRRQSSDDIIAGNVAANGEWSESPRSLVERSSSDSMTEAYIPSASATQAANVNVLPHVAQELELERYLTSSGHPRGAFLWPLASANALGIGAASSQSDDRFSVAALELLAAKAVADISSYSYLRRRQQPDVITTDATSVAPANANRRQPDMALTLDQGSSTGSQSMTQAGRNLQMAQALTVTGNSSEQFQQFHALFLRAAGSPAVRAAQALAMITRAASANNNSALGLRERAALAWDVMPMVSAAYLAEKSDGQASVPFNDELSQLQAGMGFDGGGFAQTQMSENGSIRDMGAFDMVAAGLIHPAAKPSLVRSMNGQSPRANSLHRMTGGVGEALGSLVKRESRSAGTEDDGGVVSRRSSRAGESMTQVESLGAVRRAPTAAAEMVRTGAPAKSGEAELPSWFEAAARKMFGEQSALTDGISLADMTLIQSAPTQQIAASTVGETAASTPSVNTAVTQSSAQQQFDVEGIAREVYRAVLQIMDSVRSRNGEPYL